MKKCLLLDLVFWTSACGMHMQEITLRHDVGVQTCAYLAHAQLQEITVSSSNSMESPDSDTPISSPGSSAGDFSMRVNIGKKCCFRVRMKCKCKKIAKHLGECSAGAIVGIALAILAL